MTTTNQLTNTQTTILTQATYRPDGNIEPLPPALRGGVRTKVIDGLLARDLITKFHYPDHVEYYLTDAGYAAVGRTRPAPEPEPAHEADADFEAEMAAAESTWQDAPRRTRDNSKQAQVVAMLKRPEGATVAQIMGATSWQAHTVRGTFAGAFKKKLGLTITSEKPEGGERVYHAA